MFRFALAEADVRRYAEGAPQNADHRPLLEFSAPLALYTRSTVENRAVMRSFRRTDRPPVEGLDPARYAGPNGRLRAAWVHLAEGRFEDADLELSRLGPPETLDGPQRVERARLLAILATLREAKAAETRRLQRALDDPLTQR